MRTIAFLLVLGVLPTLFGISQIDSKNDFKVFLTYLNDCKLNNDLLAEFTKEIPLDLAKKIIGNKIIDESVVSVHGIAIKTYKSIVIVIELSYPAGGDAASFYILSFSPGGKVERSQLLCHNSLDSDGGTSCSIYYTSDSILKVKEDEIRINSIGEQLIDKTKYTYLIINDDGYKDITLKYTSFSG